MSSECVLLNKNIYFFEIVCGCFRNVRWVINFLHKEKPNSHHHALKQRRLASTRSGLFKPTFAGFHLVYPVQNPTPLSNRNTEQKESFK